MAKKAGKSKTVPLALLEKVLFRENSCIAEEDVPGLMRVIRREAAGRKVPKLTGKTRQIEMFVATSNGDAAGSWTTDYVDIPLETPEDEIAEVAEEAMREHLGERTDVAFVGVYHVPDPEEEDA